LCAASVSVVRPPTEQKQFIKWQNRALSFLPLAFAASAGQKGRRGRKGGGNGKDILACVACEPMDIWPGQNQNQNRTECYRAGFN